MLVFLFCLFILTIFYFGRTIYAAGAPENSDSPDRSAIQEKTIPKEWGELKSAYFREKEGSEFYFEDKQGTIRYVFWGLNEYDRMVVKVYKRK